MLIASWGANAGLKIARDALESIKQKFPEISYADCMYSSVFGKILVWT
jgi:catalase (peroxidase I)